jgi:hypothetical protein
MDPISWENDSPSSLPAAAASASLVAMAVTSELRPGPDEPLIGCRSRVFHLIRAGRSVYTPRSLSPNSMDFLSCLSWSGVWMCPLVAWYLCREGISSPHILGITD